ncbi:MAG: TIM44-like domain-containing protein [Solirubrobacteraceae bacterium]
MGGRLAVLVLMLIAAVPGDAWALAGGATGSGGGGGGGGFSGGGGGGGYYGGSGGSGSGGKGSWIGAIAIVGGVILSMVLIQMLARRRQRPGFQGTKRRGHEARARAKRAESTAKAAQADDGYWDPDELKARVREAFFPVQSSWSQRDVSPSRAYVSEALYKRHELQLEGLERQDRVNRIEDLALDDIDIVRVVNVTDDGQDRFVAFLQCRARDWMEDTETGEMVNGNKLAPTTFQQYWSFVRDPQRGWVLDEIQQGEEGDYHMKAKDIDTDDGPARPAARA